MAPLLHLHLIDYLGDTQWRWVLSDNENNILAQHEVHLDSTSREYAAFRNLPSYLDFPQLTFPTATQLASLEVWIGEQIFGGLRAVLWEARAQPVLVVQLIVPPDARELLARPFELARFENGLGFGEAGVRFVYQLKEAPKLMGVKEPADEALRILAAFSLPMRASPLNLRRERYGLQRLVRELNVTRGLAIELRILQYGVTRATLQEALEEADGWDIVHISSYGNQNELLLEDAVGSEDIIDTDELGELLESVRSRLKLLILDSRFSNAGSDGTTERQVKFNTEASSHERMEAAETVPAPTPNLAQTLSQRLDCAAVAMRYPVDDTFAADLLIELYDKMLRQRHLLPTALHLALRKTLASDVRRPLLSPATPILIGTLASDLRLVSPKLPFQSVALPTPVGLSNNFPSEPARFVGRLMPMLRGSQALAVRSRLRGVLFYGMVGAGKTACALELAYRHEHGRFQGYVWHRAPEEGSDIATSLFNLMQDIQTQLGAPELGLTTALDDPAHFRSYTLLRLRSLLQRNSLLLVLDNMETLLSESDRWRDPLWGEVIATLLAHDGPSRVILTSRRVPADLTGNPRLLIEGIHALSFAETVLLARELPNIRRLFDDDEGLKLLRKTLQVVQGHPKLLELADGAAADQTALAQLVSVAGSNSAERVDILDIFSVKGNTDDGDVNQADTDVTRALEELTAGVADTLAPNARLLFTFLCQLEPEDRQHYVVEFTWRNFLDRLKETHPAAIASLAKHGQELPTILATLDTAGLVAVEQLSSESAERTQNTIYTIYHGVAETARAAADPVVLTAVDIELGDFYIALQQHFVNSELEHGSDIIVEITRRGVPYLLRQARWQDASNLLEQMLQLTSNQSNLAFALPLLQQIVAATVNTEEGLAIAGVLASALWKAGRIVEAEAIDRDRIQRYIEHDNYRLASVAADQLVGLLWNSGRFQEALEVVERKASYTHQAGLGPWTQLGDDVRRLQMLNAMGRYDEVLAEVARLRPHIEEPPREIGFNEVVDPWKVLDGLLDTAREAALYSNQWENALAFNAESIAVTEARGASKLEIARKRYQDYYPLTNQGRYIEARSVLLECRGVFEAEQALHELGVLYSALADLEDKSRNLGEAIHFEKVALGYRYQVGQPDTCASSHQKLADYLERQGVEWTHVLAHRLAAAMIHLQMQSGQLPIALRKLAKSGLPAVPPSFIEVSEHVGNVQGVHFQSLFERLPRTAPDGDSAIVAVCQLVADEGRRVDAERQGREAVLASLPSNVRAAFELDGEQFSTALRAALTSLPEEQAAAILQRLQEAGLIGSSVGPDMGEVLHQFTPLLQAIAEAATDQRRRSEVEPVLADLEAKGWLLQLPVQRIWEGERDSEVLTLGLDTQDSALVQHVLKLLAEQELKA